MKTEKSVTIAPGRPAPYDRLIDQQMWAFIDATNNFYPEDAVNLSIADQRKLYNTMCAGFRAPAPTGIEIHDRSMGARPVPVRVYRSTNANANEEAHVVYFHGGGFVVGDLESHNDVCAEICAATGFPLTSADYRLAPEHTHPASFDDACAVFKEISQTFAGRIILAGDSAGAGLAAAVSANARHDERQPAGQALMYPSLGGPQDSESVIAHGNAPMLTAADLIFYRGVRVAPGAPAPTDESFAPLLDEDFRGLPPTVILSAECDPLCDEGRLYAEAITAATGRAHWTKERGMVHGYLRARHMSTRAAASFDRLLRAIDALGHGQWPY